MNSWEKKSMRRDRYQQDHKNPSFSSTLLDQIYRSIDEGDKKPEKPTLYRETTTTTTTMRKKQSNNGGLKSNRAVEEEKVSSFQQACFVEQWMDKKVTEKMLSRRRQISPEFDRKSKYDNDPLFFSSSSCSSDSSSGGFSSSENESFPGSKTKVSSCFAPSRPKPKPIRTTVSEKSVRTEKTGDALFYKKQSQVHVFDDYQYNSAPEHTTNNEDREGVIKSKLRALKIYNNLKKVKQPLSPGGRLSTFINSIFTTGNSKKTKNSSTSNGGFDERGMDKTPKSTAQASTCSSASSFSRSCLSKNSPSTREKLRNGDKRTVRFYPVSVIVDEDCQPCGQKSIYEKNSNQIPVPISRKLTNSNQMPAPISRKSMNLSTMRREEELKFQIIEKNRRAEEAAAARDVLMHYRQTNEKKNGFINGDYRANREDYEDDDDDDAASDSSSDLFELDHLAFVGKNDRYCEELPVYETTHVITNRAIANGIIL